MMPNMRQAFRGLTRRVEFDVVTKGIVDHEVSKTTVAKRSVSLVMMPMPAQKIAIKPEGERAWKWWEATGDVDLDIGTMLKDADGRAFRVMERGDFGQASFYTYQLTEAAK